MLYNKTVKVRFKNDLLTKIHCSLFYIIPKYPQKGEIHVIYINTYDIKIVKYSVK